LRGGRKEGRSEEAAPMRSRCVEMNFPFLVRRGLKYKEENVNV
jgi:hypothetical protein